MDRGFTDVFSQREDARVSSAKARMAAELRDHLQQEASRNANPRLRRLQKRQEEEERLMGGVGGAPRAAAAEPAASPYQPRPPAGPAPYAPAASRSQVDAQTSPPRRTRGFDERQARGYDERQGRGFDERQTRDYGERRARDYDDYERVPMPERYVRRPPPPPLARMRYAYDEYDDDDYYEPPPPRRRRYVPEDAYYGGSESHRGSPRRNLPPEEPRRDPSPDPGWGGPRAGQTLPPAAGPGGVFAGLGQRPEYRAAQQKAAYADELRQQMEERRAQRQVERTGGSLPALNPRTVAAVAGNPLLGEPARAPGPADARSGERDAQKQAYKAFLQSQIEERNRQKAADEERRRQDDLRVERETAAYNPFGRAGGGAAVLDANGAPVTNSRLYARQREIEQQIGGSPVGLPNPSAPSPVVSSQPAAGTDLVADLLRKLDLGAAPLPQIPPSAGAAAANGSHLRGVKQVDALPLWQQDEVRRKQAQQLAYQEDLQRQMDARKAAKEKENRRAREEDEREMERIQRENEMQQRRFAEQQQRVDPIDQMRVGQGSGTDKPPGAQPVAVDKAAKARELHQRQALAEEAYLQAKAEAEALKTRQRAQRAGRGPGGSARPASPPLPAVARAASPPIPTLARAAAGNVAGGEERATPPPPGRYSFDVSQLDENSVPPALSNVTVRPGNVASRPGNAASRPRVGSSGPARAARAAPPQSATQSRPASSSSQSATRHVLEQLASIQKDLEVEKLKVQSELRRPLLPPLAPTPAAPRAAAAPAGAWRTAVVAPSAVAHAPAVSERPRDSPAPIVLTRARPPAAETPRPVVLPTLAAPVVAPSLEPQLASGPVYHDSYLVEQRRILAKQSEELLQLRRQIASGPEPPAAPLKIGSAVNLLGNTDSAPLFPAQRGIVRGPSQSSLLATVGPLLQLELSGGAAPSANGGLALLTLDGDPVGSVSPERYSTDGALRSETAIVPL